MKKNGQKPLFCAVLVLLTITTLQAVYLEGTDVTDENGYGDGC